MPPRQSVRTARIRMRNSRTMSFSKVFFWFLSLILSIIPLQIRFFAQERDLPHDLTCRSKTIANRAGIRLERRISQIAGWKHGLRLLMGLETKCNWRSEHRVEFYQPKRRIGHKAGGSGSRTNGGHRNPGQAFGRATKCSLSSLDGRFCPTLARNLQLSLEIRAAYLI